MQYVKKAELDIYNNTLALLKRLVDENNEEDMATLKQFESHVNLVNEVNIKLRERGKESMQRFRSTPYGLERSRKAARESQQRKRDRERENRY